MTFVETLKRLVHRDTTTEFEAESYWADRHDRFAGSLKAVGHQQLSDDAIADQYEVKRAQLTNMILRHEPQPKNKTLLDAGCGIGLLTSHFIEMGFEVSGVDFCETAIKQARHRAPQAEFSVSPLYQLELGRRFDIIVTVDVLLHIVDESKWRQTLDALIRHLNPHGLLIILDWFADQTNTPDHCHPRPIQSYKSVLDPHNAQIIEQTTFDLEHEGSTKNLIAVRLDV